MADTFSYQKISRQEMRLLTPRRSSNMNELRFALRTFHADNRPEYVAVSYTWGRGAANKFIYLNDTKHWIRSNLWWCLYYMSMNPEWRYIWVDYVCIDQMNIEERNEHVQNMDGIFSNASVVVAWLGVEDNALDLSSYKPMECLVHDSPELKSQANELACRPFWTRRWVIQELLLAMTVQLLCGGHCISWLSFKNWLVPDAKGDEISPTVAASPYLLNRLDHTVHYPEHSLSELLLEYRHTGCQDPRDRVFALLGLLPDKERSALASSFPDYSLSYNEVVAKTMDHLGFFQKRRNTTLLPMTEQCKEMLAALGFKNVSRANSILCSRQP